MDNTKKIKVLFLSHDATLTGAPILIRDLIRWLITNKHIEAKIIVTNHNPRNNELVKDFEELGETFVWNRPLVDFEARIRRFLSKKFELTNDYERNQLIKKAVEYDPDFVYVNSIACAWFIPTLANSLKKQILMHVHELEMSTKMYAGVDNCKNAIPFISQFIIVTSLIKEKVFKKFDFRIPDDKITVIHEYLDLKRQTKSGNEISEIVKFREGAKIIVGSGTLDWRKGTDLFIQTAIQFKNMYEHDFQFVWIGGNLSSHEKVEEFRFEVETLGLQEHICFLGQVPNLKPYLAKADLFFLSSREDPYPLVCIEAAYVGCPIVCFENSGGMVDFVDDTMGRKVNFMDTHAAASAIVEICTQPELRNNMSKASIDRAKEHDIDIVGERIWSHCLKSFYN